MTATSDAACRLSEVIGALSHALDLAEGRHAGHSRRACMIAMELAARLAWRCGRAMTSTTRRC